MTLTTPKPDRMVYEGGRVTSRKRRKACLRVRYSCPDGDVVAEYGAALWMVRVNGGVRHRLLTSGVPEPRQDRSLSSPICTKCGYAYGYLAESDACICHECRLEDIADAAKELEMAGIRLGWGYHRKDDGWGAV